MGEEKPSVPWVLEDYETSQVGFKSIQNDVELFEKMTPGASDEATTYNRKNNRK